MSMKRFVYKEKRKGSDGKKKGLKKEQSQRQEKNTHEDDSATKVK